MIEEMVELGFKRIELSHGIRISLIPGILKAVEEKLVEVGSVHNFCPLPPSAWQAAPNLLNLPQLTNGSGISGNATPSKPLTSR